MKNKSARHKELNTFKFQPFSERIANVDVDVFHRIGHEYENETEEDECFFFQAIQKWNVLNLTEGYDAFRRDVKPHNIITLPQLVHKKDHVVDSLLKHLKLKNVLCLQPLLELVVALAKDLRKDFYPYYPQFLEVLIDLLNTKDTDQLEWTFTCLAYIFKFLWRTLIKDISAVFKTLLPLLSDTKPHYINNFAAESFAFVARKVKDRKSFLTLILKAVHSNQDGVVGCGKLLFEVLNGVNGQFHSTADTMLPFLFESISDEKMVRNGLFDILEQIIYNTVNTIHPQKSDLLWRSLVDCLERLAQTWADKKSESVINPLELIIKLTGQAVEHKNGKLLQSPALLVQEIVRLLSLEDIPEKTLLMVIKIAILVLLSTNIRLSQEHASNLTRKILSLKNKSVLLYFVENVVTYPSFEALILPTFLKHCISSQLENNCFHILTQVILKKSPLSDSGINLSTWSKYTIDFGSKHNNSQIEDILIKHVTYENVSDLAGRVEDYFCSLVCLPHTIMGVPKNVLDQLKSNLGTLCKSIGDNKGDEEACRKTLFLFQSTLECAIHISTDDSLSELLPMILENVAPLTNSVALISSLKILDLFLTFLRNNSSVISLENLKKIHNVIERNLSSPYHEVRLLTTHIYSLFDNLPALKPFSSKEDWSVFNICYKVESISPQVDTYRDQLQSLERLTFDKQQMNMCIRTDFKLVPLRYMCGVLYVNFQLLWDPVTNVIASQAHGLDPGDFWKVFVDELRGSVGNVKNPPVVKVASIETDCAFLKEIYQAVYCLKVKPDFVNYRLLLWKAMLLFPEIAEAKNRDTSELFLTFIDEEYMKSNSEVALTWNIKQNSSDVDADATEVAEDQEKEDEVDAVKKELTKAVPPKTGGQNKLKALLHHMRVFTKVRSPKSMYRETELYKLYFEFLSHKNPEVQKTAMDCLMTYKHKYLTPYKDNLYNLIDDKNFKNEMATFRVDQESPLVLPEHREDLIPVVMKIVFSKMFAKTGLRTGGKASGQLRRNLVLRFLAGCNKSEMSEFIQMAFRFYLKYLQDDHERMVEDICNSVNLEQFLPPKRLQSSLNLLTIILEKFGGLIGDAILQFLLKVLLVIGASIKGAFIQNTDVHIGYLTTLRNLRSSSIKIVEKYFERFDTYPWSAKEINAVFNVFVWPYLGKLHIEGIHSPTPLLKLFTVWGANPRYFSLLVRYEGDNKEQYALPYVMKLLTNVKTHGSVTSCIMEMIQNVLSLEAGEEDMQLKLPAENILPIAQNILDHLKTNDKLNYGSCILLPHVNSILEKLEAKFRSKSKTINRRELFILSRISELVWESDVSDTILELLLPIVLKRCTLGVTEEVVLQYITTIHNLIQNVTLPQKHLKKISPLFAQVCYAGSRKILCQILEIIAKESVEEESLKVASSLISELNAWDAKWLDQPDFQRRLDAFKTIQVLVDKNEVCVELGILLIFNCFYLIRSEKDLSLRESAAHCWKGISTTLVRNAARSHRDLEYILNDTLLTLIRTGVRNKSEDVQNECVSLLGHLARECPESHVVLRDLNKLTNKTDLEVDFFENLVHLQLHRRSRALLKFCQVFRNEVSVPNTRTLTQFILPLTSGYLLNEKYSGKNSLIDAAIETIGLVCKMLPWHQYESMLKYYLGKLRYKTDFQKQLVRLIVAILDAFHFDLSKGDLSEIVAAANLVKKDVVVGATKQKKVEVDEVVGPKEADDQNKNVESVVEGKRVESQEDIEEAEVQKEGDEEENEAEELLDLDEDLDKVDEDEEDLDEEEAAEEIKACNKVNVLCKSAANRVARTIQVVLLPQLHKSLAEMTSHDASHKVNRKKTAVEKEEEDLVKVPISLAVVKLLQRLPKGILESNLPGIFMKTCTFLKSQLESVRRATREILEKIMLTLGPEYLRLLLGEMAPLLSRGFQAHVLVFTVHAVLNCLKEQYKPTHIDNVLLTIVSLCKSDLFGTLAEEKEVAKIGTKTSEAKASKCFDTFQILAQFVTEKSLMDLVLPIKEVLVTSHSFKVVNKAQLCLRHIALGLVDNNFVPVESLIQFSYLIASESIPELLAGKKKPELTEKEREKLARQKEDCLIIPKAPVGKSGVRINNVKSSLKTNAHIIVEFGLRVCYFLMKRDKVRDDDYKPYIDPFAVVFKKCLQSSNVKLSAVTLQCLGWVMRYDLPSMRENIKDIAESMFAILHKYASAGLSKGDNFDLVVATFKTMTVLVREVKYHTIDTDQLKILLLYVEQDLHDYDRQSTAFGLLKAIISRKLIVPEIHQIMDKVAELSITSEMTHVRLQARLVFHQFLMDYPLGKKLDKHVAFYLAQLNYELQTGRESALEMIQSLIYSFPLHILREQSGPFFINLGARLVNDEVPECRKMVASCLSSMLNKLGKADRDQLFDVILLWMKDRKVAHKRLGAQLCGIFVTCEKAAFESRVPNLMPVLLSQFGLNDENAKPGRGVLLKVQEDSEGDSEIERIKDHHLYQTLMLCQKLCAQCPSFLKRTEEIEKVAYYVQSLLSYPHDWVRLAAAQFLGFILTSLDVNTLATLLNSGECKDNGYLYNNPIGGVKSLALDLCAQLQPGSLKNDFAEQIIKNLVFIARVLAMVPYEKTENKINLFWLAKRMKKIVNMEVVESPSSIVLRMEVFKWIAAVSTMLDVEKITPVLNQLMAPLVREMITTEESNAPLRQLSKEVGGLIKKQIGMETYTATVSKLQQNLSVRRAERKRSRTQLAVTDPELFAKKKIKQHEKKKEAKKRKIAERKGAPKKFKRRKVVDLELDNSEIL